MFRTWNEDGKVQGKVQVFTKIAILQIILHEKYLYCSGESTGISYLYSFLSISFYISHYEIGTIVSVNPFTFEVSQTFNYHDGSIDAMASVQGILNNKIQ